MTKEEILKTILDVHNPKLAEGPQQMVAQIWEDGEFTLQKCGELLWRRNLHMIAAGYAHPELKPFLLLGLPIKWNPHAFAFVPYEKADALSKLVNNWKPEDEVIANATH